MWKASKLCPTALLRHHIQEHYHSGLKGLCFLKMGQSRFQGQDKVWGSSKSLFFHIPKVLVSSKNLASGGLYPPGFCSILFCFLQALQGCLFQEVFLG